MNVCGDSNTSFISFSTSHARAKQSTLNIWTHIAHHWSTIRDIVNCEQYYWYISWMYTYMYSLLCIGNIFWPLVIWKSVKGTGINAYMCTYTHICDWSRYTYISHIMYMCRSVFEWPATVGFSFFLPPFISTYDSITYIVSLCVAKRENGIGKMLKWCLLQVIHISYYMFISHICWYFLSFGFECGNR